MSLNNKPSLRLHHRWTRFCLQSAGSIVQLHVVLLATQRAVLCRNTNRSFVSHKVSTALLGVFPHRLRNRKGHAVEVKRKPLTAQQVALSASSLRLAIPAVLLYHSRRLSNCVRLVWIFTINPLTLSLSLQWHYSPGWASASFMIFLHPSRCRPTTVQFLHPSYATSSFTQPSQRSLGLPVGRFSPGSLRRNSMYIFLSLGCFGHILNPLTPELNPSAQRCLTRFFTGILLQPCISLIYAWKPNKYTCYSFSLLIMYGSSYMFRHYIAIFRLRF
jgi:hypothetical protein